MAKKVNKKTTIITDLIVLDNKEQLIINREKNTEVHEETISDKEAKNNFKNWEDLHRQHVEDIENESLPSMVQQAQAGEDYAIKQIVELHKDETQGDFQVKSLWWDMTLNFVKDKAIGFIIGVLRGLVKDQIPNLIKLANWLVEQLEDILINQYKKISDEEAKGIIRNELNQYNEFKRLAEKLAQLEKNK